MHMMKVISVDIMMGGLVKENILVLILWLQRVLVRQQVTVMMIMAAINININIKMAQRQVQALVLRQVTMMMVMVATKTVQRQVLALVQPLMEAEQPQQVLVLQ
jgi:hypothetical protein